MTHDEIIIIYELEQTEMVASYVHAQDKPPKIIAFDYWAERELVKRGFTVTPLTEYCKSWTDFGDLLTRMRSLSQTWHKIPEMSFFTYKGLLLGEIVEVALCNYLEVVQYYLFIFERIFAVHPGVSRLVVPHSTKSASATSGPFAPALVQAVVAAAEFLATQKGIPFKTIGVSHTIYMEAFPPVRFWRTLFLRVYNFCISVLASRRPLRIFVSDHWSNIKPFIEKMDDAELVFVERKELRHIPLRQLWKHRIRFLHPLDVLTPEIRRIARARQEEWRHTWSAAKDAIEHLPGFTMDGVNWWPIVESAFTDVVETYAERVIADIESIHAVLEEENINRVLLRASISGQHHFYILATLPHHLGIPSFEIQHGIGIGIMDPKSAFARLPADYIAAYGPLVQRAFVRNGYAKERALLTGSSRFDRYIGLRESFTPEDRDRALREKGMDSTKPVIFVVVPQEYLELTPYAISSYEFRDFILSLRDIHKAISNAQFLLKFRSKAQMEFYRSYVQEVFSEGGVVLESGDAFPLVLLSDLVYSCFSTLASESIMAKKPVVLFPLKKGDTYFYDSHKDGIVSVPLLDEVSGVPTQAVIDVTRRLITDKTFYTDAVKRGERYLAENFTFTGDAAQKVVSYLRSTSLPPKR